MEPESELRATETARRKTDWRNGTTLGMKTRTRIGTDADWAVGLSRAQDAYRAGSTVLWLAKRKRSTCQPGTGSRLPVEPKCTFGAHYVEWKPINERIIVARFRTRVRNLNFVQVYAPTDAADLQEKEEFYSQLRGVVNEIPKGDIRIYAGDFNAKLGSDNTDLERIMGPHGLGEMSENGELFTEFCGNQDMVIGGSLFPHRSVHKVTWVSRDGRTENQIDHICISRKWRRSLLDVRNMRSANIASDHHLVVGEIRLRVARVVRQEEKVGCRFNVQRLSNPEVRRAFVGELQTRALEIPDSTVEEEWQFINDAFAVIGENTLGMLRTQRKEWISDATWDKIEERKQAKAAIVSARTRATKARTRQTSTISTTLCRKNGRQKR
ncbi:hypothetical protein pipiens_006527 [Culex pipiens pipiens]|uniref:Endonuclease/exonuclease/phosphatase domain-containing protein n=1 Tax=Culex pipiens pipiens TaxID=38569 RepID=A0ABD1DRJ1_CULPP